MNPPAAPTITFINHASVMVQFQDVSVLTDPWYDGTAFNDGWSLLQPTDPSQVSRLLDSVTHIWLSHEHPDHLSIPFFRTYAKLIIERNINILFQFTKDKRVISFLRDTLHLDVIEMPDEKWMRLSDNYSIAVKKVGLYDSSLFLKAGNTLIANLNDCHVLSIRELGGLGHDIKDVDVLLTQFGYASWKSSPSSRQDAALNKLNMLHNQANLLGAKYVIPFASYIYFSAKDNSFMNDEANSPQSVVDYVRRQSAEYSIIIPTCGQKVFPIDSNLIDENNEQALREWAGIYASIPTSRSMSAANQTADSPGNPLDQIHAAVESCENRLKRKNSWALCRILAMLGIIPKVIFYVEDCDIFFAYQPTKGGRSVSCPPGGAHLMLSVDSLIFLLKHDFGLDTLSVNGRFRESRNGFRQAVRALFFGSLNSTGISLSLPSLLSPSTIKLILPKAMAVIFGRY